MVEALGSTDFHVFAWDARGHGRSPGERGYAESFSTMVRDLDEFVRFVSARYDVPIENMVVLGHSVAAVLVSAWVHDYAPPVRAMVLGDAGPADQAVRAVGDARAAAAPKVSRPGQVVHQELRKGEDAHARPGPGGGVREAIR